MDLGDALVPDSRIDLAIRSVSFQDWCDWARDQSDDSRWPHIADVAAADAKYEDDAHRTDFQQAIGDKHPRDERSYKKICWRHPLKGSPVSGSPSDYLTRCQPTETITQLRRDLFRQSGDIDRRNHAGQYQLRELSDAEWQHAGEALDIPREYWDADFFVARPVGDPDDRCVFATPQEGDDAAPSSDDHAPQFYQTIQSDRRPGETEADCAAYRLALDVRGADQDDDYVLLYYSRINIDDDSCFYPVPPDAGFNPQFDPIPPNRDASFGRTCPGPLGNCDDTRAEPELVHPNVPLVPTDVWIRPLDNETPAG